ncbi:hypothetical protein BCL90_2992 [Pedobacter alluvionis]|uniref:Uncharacterized protein n=1 Tax=Pedobacter alluvionis TaxID=475253 RepID=A0A497XZ89_9SPHI|nr:hypothetical protein BCL90_2992 [Pedobacter alluvionis]
MTTFFWSLSLIGTEDLLIERFFTTFRITIKGFLALHAVLPRLPMKNRYRFTAAEWLFLLGQAKRNKPERSESMPALKNSNNKA